MEGNEHRIGFYDGNGGLGVLVVELEVLKSGWLFRRPGGGLDVCHFFSRSVSTILLNLHLGYLTRCPCAEIPGGNKMACSTNAPTNVSSLLGSECQFGAMIMDAGEHVGEDSVFPFPRVASQHR